MRSLRHALAGLTIATAVAGCAPSAGQHTADPRTYLLALDQLVTPDFTVTDPAAPVSGASLSGSASPPGLVAAARVRYTRTADLATANGPVDVIATAERFDSVEMASGAYQAQVQRLDAAAGESPVSTGALGDAAHAGSIVATTAQGIQAVQITLMWRIGDLVNVIVVRGRYGGTRIDDALVLADRQTGNERSPA